MNTFNKNANFGLAVKYQTKVRNPDGSYDQVNDPTHNLLLDSGLDKIATNLIADCFKWCTVGDGTTPTNRDSSTTTASQSGTTVTTSGAFFESGDVGRLLKFDSGEEAYITSFTSATVVEVSISRTVSASEFTVWYVDETGHGNQIKATNTYFTEGGACGTTVTATGLTHKRTFLFSTESGAVTYNEIGWSESNTVNLFGRDLIGGGVSLSAGQQLEVIVELIVALDPVNPTAVSDVSGGTFNSAGQHCWEYLQKSVSKVRSDGATGFFTSDAAIEPSQITKVGYFNAAPTLLSGIDTTNYVATDTTGALPLTNQAYGTGNFYVDKTRKILPTEWNTDIYGLAFGENEGAGTLRSFSHKFTTPQTKESTHALDINFSVGWGRSLVN